MKSRFITDLQDSSDGFLNTDGAEVYANFLPAVPGGNPFASVPSVPAPTPVLTSQAVQSLSAQSGLPSVVSETSGSGITINLLFDAAAMAAPASFRAGIEQAASILSATISNHITVNIGIDYSGTGAYAYAAPAPGQLVSYSTVRADLINNAAPGDTTFNALPSGSSIQGQSSVAVWDAQLKLFGLLTANNSGVDGNAYFTTDINSSLLVGVALHELTHAMGRVPYGPPYGPQPDIFDLFRFTSPGTQLIDGSATAPAAYFSVDGGITKLADCGMTSDASDFLNSGVQGPNDPFNEFYSGSTSQTLSAVDKIQLDALGFNTIPEGIVVAATASQAVQGGAPVTLLSGLPIIKDPASATLSSATIKIANAGGSAVTGDELYINGVQNGSVGNGVTASWNASTSTLTLTGSATLAVYDTLLSEVSYQDTGTDASSGSHPVRTVTWTVGDGTNIFNTTSQITIDRPPVASSYVASDVAGSTITTTATSGLLSNDSDLDGDKLTVTGISDAAKGAGSVGASLAGIYGHLTLNADGSYSYVADGLSAINSAPTGSHLQDSFTYIVGDGNGGTAAAALTIILDRPPVVTAANVALGAGHASVAATSLFTASDPDGNTITTYGVLDTGNGHFVLNGVVQANNQEIDVTAAQLSQLTYQSVPGSAADTLEVRVNDGMLWSNWTSFTVTAPSLLIQTDGSTSLVEVGNNFYLDNISSGTGPELQYGGAPVTVGEWGSWTLIGAVQTATGYDVALHDPSTARYTVWSTDSSGNYLASIILPGPGSNPALQAIETVFNQDLNGDGVIGVPSPTAAFSLQYKGFDYVAFYNGAYENSSSLPSLVQTGANSIEATLDYGINAVTSQVVADPNYTDSLAALGATIAQAEKLGLSVMVRPLIDFLNPAESAPYSVGDWRQNYQPSNVAAFFASYQQMIVQEAQVAQANGAQMLSIGAELDQLAGPQYLSYWTNIITAVHQVFTGALTYSASWNTASQVSFWSQLNYEGIDCYVPLSNAQNPTLQNLVNGWLQPATAATDPGAYAVIDNQSPIQYFESLAAQSGKPLLFTELGYANDSGAAANPSASGNSPDPTLQAELYQAFFQAWTQSKSSSLIGAYFWEWDPNGGTSNVGPGIDSFSPQNSPAQSAATAGFATVSTLAGAEFVLAHAGTLEVASGTTLHINDSAINNTGDMLVAGTLAVDVSTLTLDGTGTVTLTGGSIVGSASGETLHNNANTISGTGAIGDGSGHLALDNASGTIEASGGTLILDTGATITNAGTLEAAGGATLRIDDSITGTGGAVIGAGATLELAAGDSGTVTFNSATGTLILDHASTFSGQIIGFTGDGTLAGSDHIDLRGLNYSTVHSSYNSSTGVLDVSDGTTTVDLKFAGTYSQANFKFADDGSGGTIVYDPPASSQPSPLGGTNLSVAAVHDSFVFAPNFGQNAINNFDPNHDTIQIDHTVFADVAALMAHTSDNSAGNAVIAANTHDTITIMGVTTDVLQHHLNDFIIH